MMQLPARTIYFLTLMGFLMSFTLLVQGPVFLASNGNVSFYSKAPLEDIEAHSTEMSGAIRPNTRELAFSVPMKTFHFKKSLMEEHFNERFLHTDKYPKATFTGKIVEDTDVSKPGTYNVTAKGKLTIHGVTQDRTIKGVIVSDGNTLQLKTNFPVKVADHNITIPKIVFQHIAETVDVTLDMTLTKSGE